MRVDLKQLHVPVVLHVALQVSILEGQLRLVVVHHAEHEHAVDLPGSLIHEASFLVLLVVLEGAQRALLGLKRLLE